MKILETIILLACAIIMSLFAIGMLYYAVNIVIDVIKDMVYRHDRRKEKHNDLTRTNGRSR